MKEESGLLPDCCGNFLLLDQKKYAFCYATEKRTGEKMSTGKGSDSVSGQSV